MSAIFSIDVAQEAQYLDLLGIAAGYGSVSVPIENFFEGDLVDAVILTIQGTSLTTISMTIDQVQRAQGYYEWTSASSISGHFTLTIAQTQAIAAATNCTYSVQVQVTRSENQYQREVQAGNISVRPSIPTSPLLVSSIVISGGPVIGPVDDDTQLTAVAYDSAGNAVPGVTVAWSSTDEDVATVDSDGLVTVTGLGGCTITASTWGVSGTTLATGTPEPFSVGALVYAETLSAIGFLPIGTPAQYLKVNAGATAPEWDTITAADIGPGTFQTGNFTFGGNVLFGTDNTYDIGATGATRPRDAFIGRNIVVGGTTTLGGLTYTWPGSQAASRVLGTNGSGTLSWVSLLENIALTDLTDVNITSVANGQVLQYSSGSSLWVNSFDASLLTALNATQLTSGTVPNGRLTGAYTGVTGLGTLASNLLFVDATYDVGQSGATRPRHGYFSGNVTVGSTFIGSLTNALTFGTHLTSGGSSYNNASAVTISTDATAVNTASTIVARDGSGNFAAGTITATLIGSAPAGSLTGATLAANVVSSSLTSFGVLTADLLFTDALYDIGKTGATRPRDIFASRNVTVGGSLAVTSTTTLSAALTYGGVTLSNAVTGTGNMVLSASPTFTGTVTAATISASGNITLTAGGLVVNVGDIQMHAAGTARFYNGSDLLIYHVGATATSALFTLDGTGADYVFRDAASAPILTLTASGKTATFAGAVSGITTLAAGATTLSGNLIAGSDATYDFGASGSSRFRDGFLSRNLSVGGTLAVTGTSSVAAINASGAITATAASHTFGNGGSGATNAQIILNGSSASGQGAILLIQRAGSTKGYFGNQSAFTAGATNTITAYAGSGIDLSLYSDNTLALTFSTGALATFSGSIGVSGGDPTSAAIRIGGTAPGQFGIYYTGTVAHANPYVAYYNGTVSTTGTGGDGRVVAINGITFATNNNNQATAYGLQADLSTWSKSGSGVVTNSYAAHLKSATFATNNYALWAESSVNTQALFSGYALQNGTGASNDGMIIIGGNPTTRGAIQFFYNDPTAPTLYIDSTYSSNSRIVLRVGPIAGYTNAAIFDTSSATLPGTLSVGGGKLTVSAGGFIGHLSTGAAPIAGNATLVAGTKTVNTTAITATSIVILTRKTSGGTIGTAITYTISAGTSFTITSDSILDTSTFSWVIYDLI